MPFSTDLAHLMPILFDITLPFFKEPQRTSLCSIGRVVPCVWVATNERREDETHFKLVLVFAEGHPAQVQEDEPWMRTVESS